MKKILSIIITVCVLLSAMTASIYAINLSLTTTRITFGGDSVLVSNSALEDAIEITAEEAGYIAELFIADMIASETCCWDEDTEIVDVVTLYNETGTAATAHTVELTEGYVVISAFADSESLIPEWSDTAMPIYDNLDNDENDNIIYLGGYEYFVDMGVTTVADLDGNTVNKSELVNYVESSRDINNMPRTLLESCAVGSGYMLTSNDIPPHLVDDAKSDAETYYGGTFECVDYCNLWMIDNNRFNEYVKHFSEVDIYDIYNYPNPCVPICLTNVAIAYCEKYDVELAELRTDINSNYSLFQYIVNYGMNANYYNPTTGGGVRGDRIPAYLFRALSSLSIPVSTSTTYYCITYDNIREHLSAGNLLVAILDRDGAYSTSDEMAHAVLGYAYTRFQNTSTGNYKTYLKVADGWTSHARYVDLANVVTYNNGNYEANYYSGYYKLSFS